MTEAEAVEFLRQICSGVQYLHSMGVIHLDLKPENIVCCQKDSSAVKIIDFGLAKQVKEGEVIKVSAFPVHPYIINDIVLVD